MRSVVVVLPASMWAMIPMFLNLLKSCLAIFIATKRHKKPQDALCASLWLPLVMRERFVRIRHAVRVFFLLHRIAAVVCRVENLCRQTIHHRLLTAAPRVGDDPANCQGTAPLLMHFNRNLISRSANAPRLHFNSRLHVVDR